VESKDQTDFLRQLFDCWDEDGDGRLVLDEIADPFVALDLAPDKEFVAHLLRSLNPKLSKKEDDEITVSLKEFIRIFKKDKFSSRFDFLSIIRSHEEKKGRIIFIV